VFLETSAKTAHNVEEARSRTTPRRPRSTERPPARRHDTRAPAGGRGVQGMPLGARAAAGGRPARCSLLHPRRA
jgi:hypothetical protein